MGRPRAGVPLWLDLDRLAGTRPQDGWEQYGACAGEGPGVFHPVDGDKAAVRAAKVVCARCPVIYACLATALRQQSSATTEHGVWGGTSVRERRKIRKALKELAA